MTTASLRIATALAQPLLIVACGHHVLVGRERAANMVDAGNARESGPPLDAGQILCRSTVCGTLDFGPLLGTYAPCCRERSTCGLVVSAACVELASVGVDDPSCPSLPGYAGCCRYDGTCGVATGAPLGCITLPLQPQTHCVYPDQ